MIPSFARRSVPLALAAVLVAASLLPASLRAADVTTDLAATADSYLRAGARNTNEGSSCFMRVRESGDNRSLVRFSESNIEATVGAGTLVSAHLRLYIVNNANNWSINGREIELRRILTDWTEGNGYNVRGPFCNYSTYRGDLAGVTWNCPSDLDIHDGNNQDCVTGWAGGNFAATATGTKVVIHNFDENAWIDFDVTGDVAAFLGGAMNAGWAVRKTLENQNGLVDFATRENTLLDGDGASVAPVLRLVVQQETDLDVTSDKDSYLRSGANNTNEGANTRLRIQSSGHNRVVVGFDLAAVAGKHVGTATLRLFVADNRENWGPTGHPIQVQRITSDWVEGNGYVEDKVNVRGDGVGVTWNCAADQDIENSVADCTGSANWVVNGGDFAPVPTGPTVLITNSTVQEWIVFDVTADVQAIADGVANHGWLIQKSHEADNGKIHFSSREGEHAPELHVTFD